MEPLFFSEITMQIPKSLCSLTAPLTEDDLDFYELQFENPQIAIPIQDTVRYGLLALRVTQRLSRKKTYAYHEAIRALRKPACATDAVLKNDNEETLRIIRAKALSGDRVKVQAGRRRHDDIHGLRVRLVSDASKRGTCSAVRFANGYSISPEFNRGECYSVRFDGADVPTGNPGISSGDKAPEYFRDQLQLLCVVCDEQDGTSRCGKCQREPYCSVECQRAAWPKHKLVCAPGQ